MNNFQAIVVRPTLPQNIGRNGQKTSLKVWMPPSGDISIERLEALQGAYGHELEVVPKPREGRVLIIQEIHAYSGQGVRRAALKLAGEIQNHLGVHTTIQ